MRFFATLCLGALVLGLGVTGTRALAADYGMAGCGLGSIVAKELNWKNDTMQIFAATTNGTAWSQSFGITFGTSNCGKGEIDIRKTEQKVFLDYNLSEVRTDAARGQGQYLEALGSLLGCGGEQVGAFAAMARDDFSTIFADSDPEMVLSRLRERGAARALACDFMVI